MDSKDNHKKKNELLQSEVFKVLRFPLIVGVIFIHSNMTDYAESKNVLDGSLNYPMFYYWSTLLAQVLSRVSVPLFFFMSGYLFFYKIKVYNKETYLLKLKKRCKSLLIPYIFWTLAWPLFLFFLSSLPFISNSFSNFDTLNFHFFKGALLGYEEYGMMPFVYPFWFIRDLIVCVFVSPIIYYVVIKTRWWGIALLACAWFLGINIPYLGTRGFSITSIFFFSAGAWFSVRSMAVVEYIKDFKYILVLYSICILADIFTKNTIYNQYVHSLGILIGILFWFALCAILLKKNWIRPVPFLSTASFFIFAIHEPWLLVAVRKLFSPIIHKASDLQLCVIYVVEVFMVVAIGLFLYYILKKITPKLLAIITGGR